MSSLNELKDALSFSEWKKTNPVDHRNRPIDPEDDFALRNSFRNYIEGFISKIESPLQRKGATEVADRFLVEGFSSQEELNEALDRVSEVPYAEQESEVLENYFRLRRDYSSTNEDGSSVGDIFYGLEESGFNPVRFAQLREKQVGADILEPNMEGERESLTDEELSYLQGFEDPLKLLVEGTEEDRLRTKLSDGRLGVAIINGQIVSKDIPQENIDAEVTKSIQAGAIDPRLKGQVIDSLKNPAKGSTATRNTDEAERLIRSVPTDSYLYDSLRALIKQVGYSHFKPQGGAVHEFVEVDGVPTGVTKAGVGKYNRVVTQDYREALKDFRTLYPLRGHLSDKEILHALRSVAMNVAVQTGAVTYHEKKSFIFTGKKTRAKQSLERVEQNVYQDPVTKQSYIHPSLLLASEDFNNLSKRKDLYFPDVDEDGDKVFINLHGEDKDSEGRTLEERLRALRKKKLDDSYETIVDSIFDGTADLRNSWLNHIKTTDLYDPKFKSSKSRGEILGEWLDTESGKNFYNRVGRSILQASGDLVGALSLIAGKAQNLVTSGDDPVFLEKLGGDILKQGAAEREANKALSSIFGQQASYVDDGVMFIAPLAVDLTATAGLTMTTGGAGGAMYLSAAGTKYGVRSTAKAYAAGLVGGGMRTLLKEAGEESVQATVDKAIKKKFIKVKELGKEISVGDAVGLFEAAAKGMRSKRVMFPAMAAPAFLRSAGHTYGDMHMLLKGATDADGKPLSAEEIEDRATGAAFLGGFFTVATVLGLHSLGSVGPLKRLGLGGLETWAARGGTTRGLKAILEKLRQKPYASLGEATKDITSKVLEKGLAKMSYTFLKRTGSGVLAESLQEGSDALLNTYARSWGARGTSADDWDRPFLDRAKEGLIGAAYGAGLGALGGGVRGTLESRANRGTMEEGAEARVRREIASDIREQTVAKLQATGSTETANTVEEILAAMDEASAQPGVDTASATATTAAAAADADASTPTDTDTDTQAAADEAQQQLEDQRERAAAERVKPLREKLAAAKSKKEREAIEKQIADIGTSLQRSSPEIAESEAQLTQEAALAEEERILGFLQSIGLEVLSAEMLPVILNPNDFSLVEREAIISQIEEFAADKDLTQEQKDLVAYIIHQLQTGITEGDADANVENSTAEQQSEAVAAANRAQAESSSAQESSGTGATAVTPDAKSELINALVVGRGMTKEDATAEVEELMSQVRRDPQEAEDLARIEKDEPILKQKLNRIKAGLKSLSDRAKAGPPGTYQAKLGQAYFTDTPTQGLIDALDKRITKKAATEGTPAEKGTRAAELELLGRLKDTLEDLLALNTRRKELEPDPVVDGDVDEDVDGDTEKYPKGTVVRSDIYKSEGDIEILKRKEDDSRGAVYEAMFSKSKRSGDISETAIDSIVSKPETAPAPEPAPTPPAPESGTTVQESGTTDQGEAKGAPEPGVELPDAAENKTIKKKDKKGVVKKLLDAAKRAGVKVTVVKNRATAVKMGLLSGKGRKGSRPNAVAYRGTDGTVGIILYNAGITGRTANQIAQTLKHEMKHVAQYLYESTEEGAAAAAEAEQIFDKDSPLYDAKLNAMMREEYEGWSKLSNRSKLREASRALLEAVEDKKVSGEAWGFLRLYAKKFLAYAAKLFDKRGDTALAKYLTQTNKTLADVFGEAASLEGEAERDAGKGPVKQDKGVLLEIDPKQKAKDELDAIVEEDVEAGALRRGGAKNALKRMGTAVFGFPSSIKVNSTDQKAAADREFEGVYARYPLVQFDENGSPLTTEKEVRASLQAILGKDKPIPDDQWATLQKTRQQFSKTDIYTIRDTPGGIFDDGKGNGGTNERVILFNNDPRAMKVALDQVVNVHSIPIPKDFPREKVNQTLRADTHGRESAADVGEVRSVYYPVGDGSGSEVRASGNYTHKKTSSADELATTEAQKTNTLLQFINTSARIDVSLNKEDPTRGSGRVEESLTIAQTIQRILSYVEGLLSGSINDKGVYIYDQPLPLSTRSIKNLKLLSNSEDDARYTFTLDLNAKGARFAVEVAILQAVTNKSEGQTNEEAIMALFNRGEKDFSDLTKLTGKTEADFETSNELFGFVLSKFLGRGIPTGEGQSIFDAVAEHISNLTRHEGAASEGSRANSEKPTPNYNAAKGDIDNRLDKASTRQISDKARAESGSVVQPAEIASPSDTGSPDEAPKEDAPDTSTLAGVGEVEVDPLIKEIQAKAGDYFLATDARVIRSYIEALEGAGIINLGIENDTPVLEVIDRFEQAMRALPKGWSDTVPDSVNESMQSTVTELGSAMMGGSTRLGASKGAGAAILYLYSINAMGGGLAGGKAATAIVQGAGIELDATDVVKVVNGYRSRSEADYAPSFLDKKFQERIKEMNIQEIADLGLENRDVESLINALKNAGPDHRMAADLLLQFEDYIRTNLTPVIIEAGNHFAGSFSPTGEVTVNVSGRYGDGVISVILHEVGHAVFQRIISAPDAELTSGQRAAVKQMQVIYDRARKQWENSKKRGIANRNLDYVFETGRQTARLVGPSGVIAASGDLPFYAGADETMLDASQAAMEGTAGSDVILPAQGFSLPQTRSFEEFFTSWISSSDFQEATRKIAVGDRSLFRRIIDAIKTMFGVRTGVEKQQAEVVDTIYNFAKLRGSRDLTQSYEDTRARIIAGVQQQVDLVGLKRGLSADLDKRLSQGLVDGPEIDLFKSYLDDFVKAREEGRSGDEEASLAEQVLFSQLLRDEVSRQVPTGVRVVFTNAEDLRSRGLGFKAFAPAFKEVITIEEGGVQKTITQVNFNTDALQSQADLLGDIQYLSSVGSVDPAHLASEEGGAQALEMFRLASRRVRNELELMTLEETVHVVDELVVTDAEREAILEEVGIDALVEAYKDYLQVSDRFNYLRPETREKAEADAEPKLQALRDGSPKEMATALSEMVRMDVQRVVKGATTESVFADALDGLSSPYVTALSRQLTKIVARLGPSLRGERNSNYQQVVQRIVGALKALDSNKPEDAGFIPEQRGLDANQMIGYTLPPALPQPEEFPDDAENGFFKGYAHGSQTPDLVSVEHSSNPRDYGLGVGIYFTKSQMTSSGRVEGVNYGVPTDVTGIPTNVYTADIRLENPLVIDSLFGGAKSTELNTMLLKGIADRYGLTPKEYTAFKAAMDGPDGGFRGQNFIKLPNELVVALGRLDENATYFGKITQLVEIVKKYEKTLKGEKVTGSVPTEDLLRLFADITGYDGVYSRREQMLAVWDKSAVTLKSRTFRGNAPATMRTEMLETEEDPTPLGDIEPLLNSFERQSDLFKKVTDPKSTPAEKLEAIKAVRERQVAQSELQPELVLELNNGKWSGASSLKGIKKITQQLKIGSQDPRVQEIIKKLQLWATAMEGQKTSDFTVLIKLLKRAYKNDIPNDILVALNTAAGTTDNLDVEPEFKENLKATYRAVKKRIEKEVKAGKRPDTDAEPEALASIKRVLVGIPLEDARVERVKAYKEKQKIAYQTINDDTKLGPEIVLKMKSIRASLDAMSKIVSKNYGLGEVRGGRLNMVIDRQSGVYLTRRYKGYDDFAYLEEIQKPNGKFAARRDVAVSYFEELRVDVEIKEELARMRGLRAKLRQKVEFKTPEEEAEAKRVTALSKTEMAEEAKIRAELRVKDSRNETIAEMNTLLKAIEERARGDVEAQNVASILSKKHPQLRRLLKLDTDALKKKTDLDPRVRYLLGQYGLEFNEDGTFEEKGLIAFEQTFNALTRMVEQSSFFSQLKRIGGVVDGDFEKAFVFTLQEAIDAGLDGNEYTNVRTGRLLSDYIDSKDRVTTDEDESQTVKRGREVFDFTYDMFIPTEGFKALRDYQKMSRSSKGTSMYEGRTVLRLIKDREPVHAAVKMLFRSTEIVNGLFLMAKTAYNIPAYPLRNMITAVTTYGSANGVGPHHVAKELAILFLSRLRQPFRAGSVISPERRPGSETELSATEYRMLGIDQRTLELTVINQQLAGGRAGDISELFFESLGDVFEASKRSRLGKVKDVAKAPFKISYDVVASMAQAIDTATKVAIYKKEMRVLNGAQKYEKDNGVDLGYLNMSEEAQQQLAAQKTVSVAPTYSEHTLLQRNIRRLNPFFFDAFSGFFVDQFRIFYNQILTGTSHRETKDRNPIIASNGSKRRLGSMLTHGSFAGVVTGSTFLALKVILDREEEELLEANRPSYARNNSYFYVKGETLIDMGVTSVPQIIDMFSGLPPEIDPNKIYSVDVTYINGMSPVIDGSQQAFIKALAGMKEGEAGTGFKEAAATMYMTYLERFLGQTFSTNRTTGKLEFDPVDAIPFGQVPDTLAKLFIKGEDPDGRPLLKEGMDNTERLSAVFDRVVLDTVLPSNLEKLKRYYKERDADDPDVQKRAEQILSSVMAPLKVREVDPSQGMRTVAYEINREREGVRTLIKDKLKDGSVSYTDKEIEDLARRAVKNTVETDRKLISMIETSRNFEEPALRLTDEQIYNALTKAGVGKNRAKAVLRSKTERYLPSKAWYIDLLKADPDGEWPDKRARIYDAAVRRISQEKQYEDVYTGQGSDTP